MRPTHDVAPPCRGHQYRRVAHLRKLLRARPEKSARDRGKKVLMRGGYLTAAPEVADFFRERRDDSAKQTVIAESTLARSNVCARAPSSIARTASTHSLRNSSSRERRARASPKGQSREQPLQFPIRTANNCADGMTGTRDALQQEKPLHIRLGITALPRFASGGSHRAIAFLPRPQDVRRQSGRAYHGLEREVCRFHI